MEPIKLIYIAGSGRSGSTIIARVLGATKGVLSLSELQPLLRFGFSENRLCACGVSFRQCAFWSKVAAQSLGGEVADVASLLRLEDTLCHSRHFLRFSKDSARSGWKREEHQYVACLEKIYRAIATITGRRILIESSKRPVRALLLARVPGIEVHVIHLVRDSRAVAYAWQKKKYDPATRNMLTRYSPARSATFWMMRNVQAEMLARRLPYYRLRYEDFTDRPMDALQETYRNIAPLGGKAVPLNENGCVWLPELHAISGNPQRFSKGETTIRRDEAWKENISPSTRRLTTLMTFPLLRRYGYLGRG